MTSPALLYPSLDTPESLEHSLPPRLVKPASWRPTGSPAGSLTAIKANPPDASGVTPRCGVPDRTCPGPPDGPSGPLPGEESP